MRKLLLKQFNSNKNFLQCTFNIGMGIGWQKHFRTLRFIGPTSSKLVVFLLVWLWPSFVLDSASFFCGKMLSVLKEQRINMEFVFKNRKFATETYHMFREEYDCECFPRAWVFEWFKRFQVEREHVQDDFRLGRLSMSTTGNFSIFIRLCALAFQGETINQH